MENLNLNDLLDYVETNISTFHQKRIDSMKKLKLNTVLKRKNPYLFKAKNILTAEQIVKGITDAFISSNEETIFGNWLEGLAIYINSKVYNGRKSGIKGIDLEFDKNEVRYIVAIKSGPNWGNSSQISKMRSDFKTAIKTLRTSSSNLHIIAINGCSYGYDKKPDKGDYFKYCGQKFWEFISGNKDLYLDLIQPLSTNAKKCNDEFLISYSNSINLFTKEFIESFCKNSGEINWEKLVKFNTGTL